MKTTKMLTILVLALGLMVCLTRVSEAAPMGTAWTYQGRLIDANKPADGIYDLEFKLYGANVAGTQNGSTIVVNELDVIDGLFTVLLDFGSNVFDGNAVWLEIGVRAGELEDPNVYTTLIPRQQITPTPYSLQTRGLFVDNAGKVGIGTTVPISKLEVMSTQNYHGIRSIVPNIAVYGHRTGTSGTWPGILGECDSLSSDASGVRGVISSTSPGTNAAGVWGMNAGTGSSGVGVRGSHDGSGRGVWGHTASSSGYAGYFTGGQNYFEGKVGIGTLTPTTRLDIANPSSGPALTVGRRSGYPSIAARSDAAGGWLIMDSNGAGNVGLNYYDDGNIILANGGGNVGIGTTSPSRKLTVRGNLLLESENTGAAVVELGEGLDYAEGFNVSQTIGIEPGSVLIIDPISPGKLILSSKPYDTKVAGIVAGSKGLGSGVRLGVGQFDCDVALAGRVYCNVDATEAGIEPGDLLTTSSTRGCAMKAADSERAQGAILGKAMEPLEKGKTGQILVLVTLQ